MDIARERLASEFDCPLYAALAVLGGRWKPLILWELLENGPQRFLALQRALRGIRKKVLSQQLQELVACGLVEKTTHRSKIPHTEYRLTGYGATTRPVLDALCTWGETVIGDPGGVLDLKARPLDNRDEEAYSSSR
jgi:DNA-binding HxlR family transcriptional regulator